jgi:hypothetical protein
MGCAALVAEYAKADPTFVTWVDAKGGRAFVRECFHCHERAPLAKDIAHGWNCFWARCARHEQPTVTVR